ncbi:MAG: UDP-N-acetylglucosamine--N-acetylmuramyl-(pentapeptide) pyrophosphoryl-undecaprenol N-acetylglucosamine transferase [bacterium]|nr:UDP-N-acetylglucosamine--N-acetylmuramyl-(pentapeptide) pyrophosphoryl-undecaprenol N-acetylglucosamine transferase [bacterium]
MHKLRVLLTGGGTGGHIFPLIAVAEELQSQAQEFGLDLDLRYFGGDYEYAQNLTDQNIKFVPIISSKLRRYWSFLNLIDFIKFPFSLLQISWKIFWFMPDVVFSKGGPGALAVVLVSRLYFIPVVIHESDSIPGLTNKISGFFAKKTFLAFSSAEPYLGKSNAEIVGNPVRKSLMAELNFLEQYGEDAANQAKKSLGLNLTEPVILFLGGSQGARRINDFILENLEILIRDFQILHQVGERNYDVYKKEFEFLTKDWSDIEKNRYQFKAFFDKDLAEALLASGAVVARAGSGTIFELAAFGKPAILIPLLESANGHQKKNAYLYSETGAALVIQEENLLGNLLVTELKTVVQNKDLLKKMSDSARSFYKPDSAKIIAKHLLSYV